MDVYKQTIYLLSNANGEIYENNSLVEFKNKLPYQIQVNRNEGIEVALSFVGLSNYFKNIKTPPHNLPSFLISWCKKNQVGNDEEGYPVQIPINFDFSDQEDRKSGDYHICNWFKYYFENKYYSLNELQTFFADVAKKTRSLINLTDDMRLEIISKERKDFFILLHPTMIDSFNFQIYYPSTKSTKISIQHNDVKEIQYVSTSSADLVLRKVYYKSHPYYAFHIAKRNPPNMETFLVSESSSLSKKFPNVVRVICDNISPQIFNSTYSKDLIVYCPDFDKKEDFSATEFVNKQYVPISNTSIDTFSIKIVDRDNQPIQLLPGPATILKMDLRLRREGKKSFNVRLTSDASSEYPDNNNTSFKVQLPGPIILNRDWRVTLTSISHCNRFSTFLPDESTRSLLFKQDGVEVKFFIPDLKHIYTQEELIGYINTQLLSGGIGSVSTISGKCKFTFEKDTFFVASNYVLKILGFHGQLNSKKNYTILFCTSDPSIRPQQADLIYELKKENDEKSIIFSNEIDLNYLKPNYIIVYTDIVSKTIMGGSQSNILKIVPIKSSTDDNYIISDFKNKEYYELQNTEVTSIEINLRSHDGQLINFANYQDTILNLEFSNHYEITN